MKYILHPNAKNLINQRFGSLVVEKPCSKRRNLPGQWWFCKCDCGGVIEAKCSELTSGHISSCGCGKKSLQDLVSQKFGKLTVIGKSDLKIRNETSWICLCDCGTTTVVAGHRLKSGHTKSCGCLRFESKNLQNHSGLWKGVGEISGSFMGRLQRRAFESNIELTVTADELWKLFLAQNRKCIFTGLSLIFETGYKIYDGTASLDRKNSNLGYIQGNIQWVHKKINFMKGSLPDDTFIEFCMLVAANSKIL